MTGLAATVVIAAFDATIGATDYATLIAAKCSTILSANGTAVCASDQTTDRTAFRQAQWPTKRSAEL